MADRRIEPAAENYAVWYAYALGMDKELVKAIDILDSNRQDFDVIRNHDLFERYISPKYFSSSMLQHANGLDDLTEAALSSLKLTSTGTAAYAASLDAAGNNLQQPLSSEKIPKSWQIWFRRPKKSGMQTKL